MKRHTMERILKALYLLQWPRPGGGLTLAEVSFWSMVPRSTTYRYLQKLEAISFVDVEYHEFRGAPAAHYKISDDGTIFFEEECA